MANWFYYNASGEKIEVTGAQLKALAMKGIITPDTTVETAEGKNAPARRVKGLTFAETVQPEASSVATPSDSGIYGLSQSEPIVTASKIIPPQATVPAAPVQAVSVPPPTPPVAGTSGKSRMIAALLAFFLGGFGIHKFYMGSWKWGIVFLVFFWTYIPCIIGIIESIIYSTMSDETFAEKYSPETKKRFHLPSVQSPNKPEVRNGRKVILVLLCICFPICLAISLIVEQPWTEESKERRQEYRQRMEQREEQAKRKQKEREEAEWEENKKKREQRILQNLREREQQEQERRGREFMRQWRELSR
jgi:TM2 domain-containing membrane protein YozV